MEDISFIIGALISSVLSVLMIVTGNAFFIFASVIVGAITGFSWLFSSAGTRWHFIAGIIACALLVSNGCIFFLCTSSETSITEVYHPIYTVTAPFGVIWVDTIGEISGGLFYTSGSMNSYLSESYIAKYLDGNLLRTVTTNSSIVVDGNFTLEEKITTTHLLNNFWNWNKTGKVVTDWIIHLPSLPEVNQTSGDYRYVP